MFPDADVPVLQMSMPTLDPRALFRLGQKLAPLRDAGTLIVGSGFTTHNLREFNPAKPADAPPPGWSREFDAWAQEAMAHEDVDALLDFLDKAPAARVAHPRTEHFAPLFVSLGAAYGADGSGGFDSRQRHRRVLVRTVEAVLAARLTEISVMSGDEGMVVSPRRLGYRVTASSTTSTDSTSTDSAVGLRSERGPVLIAIMVSTGLIAIDATILATAVPSIVRELGGFSAFPWLFSVYLLAQAVSVPVYAKLADTVGRKPLMLFGIGMFMLGSILCGFAWSMPALIAFRALQGLGAGAVQPMSDHHRR